MNAAQTTTSGFMLLPPGLDKCQACAVKHLPSQPHNQQSLHYQYWFYGLHQRWPTWWDAMAHCTPEVRALWIQALKEKGVDVVAPGSERSPSC